MSRANRTMYETMLTVKRSYYESYVIAQMVRLLC